ncbi:MAG: hypothetical protein ABSE73_09035 [Planctomycetota bacterium]
MKQRNEAAAPAQALGIPPAPAPATVTRYLILMRGSKAVEILGGVYRDEATAAVAAEYWQRTSPNNEKAEVVAVQVPTAGRPIPTARDLFSTGEKSHD